MKKIILYLFLFFAVAVQGQEQTSKKGDFYENVKVNIDADLKEWRDLLIPVDEDSSWSYAVSFDDEYLYAALELQNVFLQQEAVRTGIFVNVNGANKTQEGAALFFPVPDRELAKEYLEENKNNSKDVRSVLLEFVRGYRVHGFDKLPDGLISLQNTYGLDAKVRLTEEEFLHYEARIPLSTINIKTENKAVAVQVGVNTQWVQMQRLRNTKRGNAWNPNRNMQTIKNPYDFENFVWLRGELK